MQVEMTEIVMPGHTNHLGTCFGGTIMSWIDIAAAIAAQRLVGTVVTASVDSIQFKKPIKLGDIVTIKASVNRIWDSSLEVGVVVFVQRFSNGKLLSDQRVCRAYLTFVAISEDGEKRSVEPFNKALIKRTESNLLWKIRYDSADERRNKRLERKV